MAKCSECNGSNYDEWWMCADCYRAISFKELEQLKREIAEKAWNHGVADYRHYIESGDRNTFEDYWQKQATKKDGEG